jgi:hypothetical protein
MTKIQSEGPPERAALFLKIRNDGEYTQSMKVAGKVDFTKRGVC